MKEYTKYDCHNKTYTEVEDEFENWLLLNQTPLTVITGNSEKMRNIIICVLQKHKYNYFINQYNLGAIQVL